MLPSFLLLAFAAAAAGQIERAVTTGKPLTTTSSNSASSLTSSQSSYTTSLSLSVEDFWDMYVGPVEISNINTTVKPTPIPTSQLIPPPPLQYPKFPAGPQVPLMSTNKSWSFGKNWKFWGVASAAYQIEGAVKDEGRGPSIWDVLLHRVTDYSVANQTGDVGDNQYYWYKQDITRIAALGVPYYSFSISWSRIMPFGRGQVNEQGLQHYDDLINFCLKMNVKPMVTLYHWDLPLYLQNLYGGWLSSDIVADFVAYAEVVYKRYGDRVDHWFTVNEPIVFCENYPLPLNYFKATTIPEHQQPFWCGHHVLLAHSQAYRLGKKMMPNSTIAFKTNGGDKIPLTSSKEDAIATQRAWDFNEGWFANPVYINGDYPKYLKQYVSTFLPAFTTAQKTQINGSADLFAHDAYTSQFYFAPDGGIDSCTSNSSNSLYPGCFNTTYTYSSSDGGWNIGTAADPGSPWLHKATDWVPSFMRYIQNTWKPAGGIAITEFGFSEPYESLRTLQADYQSDYIRSAYYQDYMEAILMAISEGTNIIGTLAWSIMDNLEWSEGYTTRFGMQYVNFTTQERFYKASFFYYVDAFKKYLPGGVNATMLTS